MPDPISHPAAAVALRNLLVSERCLWIEAGDSNIVRVAGGGSKEGWDTWLTSALHAQYGMWASHIFGAQEYSVTGTLAVSDGFGRAVGWRCSINNSNVAGLDSGAASGAPGEQSDTMPGANDAGVVLPHVPNGYLYYPAGTSFSPDNASQLVGMRVEFDHPITNDAQPDLRASFAWGGFDTATGAGRFQLWDVSGGVRGPVINTEVGSTDQRVALLDFSVPVAASSLMRWHNFFTPPARQDVTGPFIGYRMCVINRNITSGIAVHNFTSRGAWSMIDILNAFGSDDVPITRQSDRPLDDLLRQFDGRSLDQSGSAIPQEIGPSKACALYLNTAVNDKILAPGSAPSRGPNPADSSTVAGYADNLHAYIRRYRRIALAAGWRPFVVLQASHPKTIDTGSGLPLYRAAAAEVVDSYPDAFAVDVSELISADELLAQGLYETPGTESGQSHLTNGTGGGYDVVSRLIVNAIGAASASPGGGQRRWRGRPTHTNRRAEWLGGRF